jgi:predicted nucleic acid-binding Zn ribbon protein
MLQLKEVLKGIKLPAVVKAVEENEIIEIWQELFADSAAKYTKPISFYNSLLRVAVKDTIQLQELYLSKPQFLQRLNKTVGSEKIKDIKFYFAPQEFRND